jgi:hypothetical protein
MAAPERAVRSTSTVFTLVVNAAPTPIYEGDTVTFTASSTDGRPVSVRSWVWQDSAGATVNVACTLSSSTCKFAPLGSGRMFVRARVGNNPYIEQAAAWLKLLPVPLSLEYTPTDLTVLDSATLTVVSQPQRPVTQVSLSPPVVALSALRTASVVDEGSLAVLLDARCGLVQSNKCTAVAARGGLLHVSALVNGRLRQFTTNLTVLPLTFEAMSDSLGIDSDSTNAVDDPMGERVCGDQTADLGPLLGPAEVAAEVPLVKADRRPGRNYGPALVIMNSPFTFQRPAGNRWIDHIKTPTAWYRPRFAQIDAPNLPNGFVIGWVREESNGALFECYGRSFQNQVAGRIVFADRVQVKFSVVWSPLSPP